MRMIVFRMIVFRMIVFRMIVFRMMHVTCMGIPRDIMIVRMTG